MNKKRALLISNPVSGKGSRASQEDIGMELRLAGYEVSECQTTINQEENQDIYSAAYDYEAVVCNGGDGTLNAVVNGLLKNNCSTPILYIPTGTTNDLAKSLQLPGTISESIKSLKNNVIRPLDIGLFNGQHYFTYIASIGAFTDISYSTPQRMKNLFGHTAYVLKGIASLPKEMKPIKATIRAESGVYEDDFLFCSISNSTSIGGALSLQSEAVQFDDGLFEVILIHKPRSAQELWNIARALVNQTYLTNKTPGIDFFRTTQLYVETENPTAWTLDGEYGGLHKSVSVEALTDGIQLISA